MMLVREDTALFSHVVGFGGLYQFTGNTVPLVAYRTDPPKAMEILTLGYSALQALAAAGVKSDVQCTCSSGTVMYIAQILSQICSLKTSRVR